jgi:hypothetical protein
MIVYLHGWTVAGVRGRADPTKRLLRGWLLGRLTDDAAGRAGAVLTDGTADDATDGAPAAGGVTRLRRVPVARRSA